MTPEALLNQLRNRLVYCKQMAEKLKSEQSGIDYSAGYAFALKNEIGFLEAIIERCNPSSSSQS